MFDIPELGHVPLFNVSALWSGIWDDQVFDTPEKKPVIHSLATDEFKLLEFNRFAGNGY